jgi:voltage-gated potassium channel
VRKLWRDRRVRSLISLVAVLVVYFAIPLDTNKSPARLAVELTITVLAMALVAAVTIREFRRMQLGEALQLTGGQLLVVLELVLVVFALTYYSLATHGTNEMAGIQTRIDSLYFTATTIATVGYGDIHSVGQVARVINTVQMVFDVVFIAAFIRLISTAAEQHHRSRVSADGDDEEPLD